MKRAVLTMCVAIGCVAAPGNRDVPSYGGQAAFESIAQPVLVERCANPSCHGDPGRPLSLYAVRRHRRDPRDVYAETPLEDSERAHNFAQTTAFLVDVASARDSLLLKKPLAPETHDGGAVFLDESDYGYQQLRAWIETALAAGGAR